MPYTGSKYNSNISTTAIAKILRKAIHTEQKWGTIPKEMTISVTTEYYSMGSTIHLIVKQLPDTIPVFDPKGCGFFPYAHETKQLTRNNFGCGAYAPQLKAILKRLAALDSEYNYNYSDLQTDYYAVGHAYSAKVNNQIERMAEDALYENFKETGFYHPKSVL